MSDPLLQFRLFFSEKITTNSIEEFIQNRHLILKILRKLLKAFQVDIEYARTIVDQDVVNLIRLMQIIGDLFTARRGENTTKIVLHLPTLTTILQDDVLKEIERSLLICASLFVLQNEAVHLLIICNFDYLKAIFYFTSSASIRCQILSLEIFANICTNPEKVAKVLQFFKFQSVGQKSRFSFLTCILNLSNQKKSVNCLAVSLDLVNRILANISKAEQMRVKGELENVGFTVQALQTKAKQMKPTQGALICEKIRQFREVCCMGAPTAIDSQVDDAPAGQYLGDQVRRLNEAMNKLDGLFCQLKDKLNSLIELSPSGQQHYLKGSRGRSKTDMSHQSSSLAPVYSSLVRADSMESVENVKSSEEETVSATVIHSNDIAFAYGKSDLKFKRQHSQQSSPLGSTNLHTSKMDNFRATAEAVTSSSKYFSYIMDQENDLDAFVNRDRSRKPINRMLKSNLKSAESICPYDACCAPLSRSAIAGNQLEQLDIDMQESPRSLSLPNAFRSNFILRPNSDIYFSKAPLHCSADRL